MVCHYHHSFSSFSVFCSFSFYDWVVCAKRVITFVVAVFLVFIPRRRNIHVFFMCFYLQFQNKYI